METSIIHYMQPAIEPTQSPVARRHTGQRAATLALVLVSSIPSFFASAQQIAVVDLTKPAPPEARSIGVPGGAVGIMVDGESRIFFPPQYKLPLEITIRRLMPPAPGARAAVEPKPPDFALEVLLKNIGDTPFDLPVGRNPAQAHRHM